MPNDRAYADYLAGLGVPETTSRAVAAPDGTTSADVLALLTSGEETMLRDLAVATNSPGSGTMRLTYFRARKTETITQAVVSVGAVAGAGLTLARLGVYAVAANGDLTLVASTPNDATMFGSTNVLVTKAFSASWRKVAGRVYAFGVLCVGTTAPTLYGSQPTSLMVGYAPRIAGAVFTLTDLPNTQVGPGVGTTGQRTLALLLP